MKKIFALFAAVFLCLIAQGRAQVIFDPSVQNVFTNITGFTGTIAPPSGVANRLTLTSLQFNVGGLTNTNAFNITGILLRGQGITTSLSFNNVEVPGADGGYATETKSLNTFQTNVAYINNSVALTLPGGSLNRGSYVGVTLQYRNGSGTQVLTSTDVTLLGGGRIWTGYDTGTPGEATGNWDDPDNWAGVDVPEGGSTVDFLFGGTLNTTNTNNLAAGTDMRGIEFLDGAGAFTIEGNSVDFNGGKIENNSVNTQTINFDFTFNGGNQQVNPNTGDITLGGGGTISNNGFDMEVNGPNTLTIDKTIQGTGGLTLEANSRVNITENQTFTGDITVKNNAVLLISQSDSISNDVDVTLSGGTIQRGSGVSEVFGNLNLTTASFLDFGTGSSGTLAFGTYTPNFKLNVLNFLPGNVLTFNQDLSSSINNTSLFSFSNGFTSNWNSTTGTFTITAIPEPSTYVAAAGLLAMFLWSARRRLFKTAGAQPVASGAGAA